METLLIIHFNKTHEAHTKVTKVQKIEKVKTKTKEAKIKLTNDIRLLVKVRL